MGFSKFKNLKEKLEKTKIASVEAMNIATKKANKAFEKGKEFAGEAFEKGKDLTETTINHLDEKYKLYKSESSTHVLVRFNKECEDEFDVSGFKLMTKGENGNYIKEIAEKFNRITSYNVCYTKLLRIYLIQNSIANL